MTRDAGGRSATVSNVLYAAVLESRTRWRQMVQSAADLVFETDAAGNLVYLWPATVLGWPAASLLGTPASALLARSREDFNPFAPGPAQRGRPVRLRGRDNRTVKAVFVCTPVHTDDEVEHTLRGGAPPSRPTASQTGGMRGFAVLVAQEPTLGRLPAAALTNGLAAIFWRMRAQILPGAMIQSALQDLLTATKAAGAALLLPPAAEADAQPTLFEGLEPLSGPRAALRYRVGTMLRGFDEALYEQLASHIARLIGTQPEPWHKVIGLHEQDILLCGAPGGIGNLAALALWRPMQEQPWGEEIIALASAVAAVACAALDQEELAQEISRHTRGDTLTGLLTRDAFAEEVERRFDRLDRAGLAGTLMLADIAQFGAINDVHGSERADALLRQTAILLRDAVRPTDLVSRIAGDVFAIWLDGADRFAAAERAEQLCVSGQPASKAIASAASPLPMLPHMAIGMALRAPRSFEPLDSLLIRAKSALAAAKRAHHGKTLEPGSSASAWTMSQEEPTL